MGTNYFKVVKSYKELVNKMDTIIIRVAQRSVRWLSNSFRQDDYFLAKIEKWEKEGEPVVFGSLEDIDKFLQI
jgi:hypothetical protein